LAGELSPRFIAIDQLSSGFNHDITMGSGNCASLKHFVYLKLDGPFPAGMIAVNFPPAPNIDLAHWL
jgi:hypothetical protein